MARLYVLMGKSSTGKDTIFKLVVEKLGDQVKTVIPYTTRPIREGEQNGVEYFFITEKEYESYKAEHKIIEERAYDTVYGIWRYMTINDGQIDLEKTDSILIGTLEAYEKIKLYFGKEKVLPIYIEVEDGERLKRAIHREEQQERPAYEEMCRRFLADAKDFSKEKLEAAGIEKSYQNKVLEETVAQIAADIQNKKSGGCFRFS